MQEICSSNPPMVIGIWDPNKSRAWHHCRLKDVIFYLTQKLTKISMKYPESAIFLSLLSWIRRDNAV